MEAASEPRRNFAEESYALLKSCPLIDGHNDFPYIIRGWLQNNIKAGVDKLPIGQTDLHRLRSSGLGAQFWSAFVPCAKETSKVARLTVLEHTLQQIDTVHQMVAAFPEQLGSARSSADVWALFNAGKLASLIGVEGLHQIAGSASCLRLFHRLDVRYITLCHDQNNEYVDSATAPGPVHGGVSNAGEAILREMNRVGMIIDLSHTSHDAQRRVLQLSRAPVIFSHSCAFTLSHNPRNVPDDVLDALQTNGGVCMICFLPNLCSSERRSEEGPSIASVIDHIIYVGTRIGFEHVGIGSDFDGMLEGPPGLDDVRGYPGLVEEMLRRGIPPENVKLVMGLNILRILDDVEKVALQIQSDGITEVLVDSIAAPWSNEQKEMLRQQGRKRGLA